MDPLPSPATVDPALNLAPVIYAAMGGLIIAGLQWFLYRHLPDAIDKLKTRIEGDQERRLNGIEKALIDLKTDHDAQIRLAEAFAHMEQALGGKLDDIRRELAGQDERQRGHDRTLASIEARLETHGSRLDDLHRSVNELAPRKVA